MLLEDVLRKGKTYPLHVLRIPLKCYANAVSDVGRRVKAREDWAENEPREKSFAGANKNGLKGQWQQKLEDVLDWPFRRSLERCSQAIISSNPKAAVATRIEPLSRIGSVHLSRIESPPSDAEQIILPETGRSVFLIASQSFHEVVVSDDEAAAPLHSTNVSPTKLRGGGLEVDEATDPLAGRRGSSGTLSVRSGGGGGAELSRGSRRGRDRRKHGRGGTTSESETEVAVWLQDVVEKLEEFAANGEVEFFLRKSRDSARRGGIRTWTIDHDMDHCGRTIVAEHNHIDQLCIRTWSRRTDPLS